MSWHFLRELEAASWQGDCSDGIPDALSRLIPTRETYCWPDNETECSADSQFGMMYERSTVDHGATTSTSSPVVFHAKTYRQLELPLVSMAPKAGSGEKWRELPMKYDRHSCSWKIRPCSDIAGSKPSSVILPRWGMMRAGVCWELATLPRLTNVSERGSWLATPTATANQLAPSMQKWEGCQRWLKFGHVGGKIDPHHYEWLMGWPIGWSDTEPLEMAKYQRWLHLHS